MRNFFSNMRYRMQQWMTGRYGNDEFNRFLSVAAFVFLIISCFGRLCTALSFFYIPGILLLIYTIVRSLSRNFSARSKEREFYFKVKDHITGFFNLQRRRWIGRKLSRYYRCPKCRTIVRVPKGKGKIQITCPRCRSQFIKRT